MALFFVELWIIREDMNTPSTCGLPFLSHDQYIRKIEWWIMLHNNKKKHFQILKRGI